MNDKGILPIAATQFHPVKLACHGHNGPFIQVSIIKQLKMLAARLDRNPTHRVSKAGYPVLHRRDASDACPFRLTSTRATTACKQGNLMEFNYYAMKAYAIEYNQSSKAGISNGKRSGT